VTPIRIVIVTMDTHLASATERARVALLRELPGVTLVTMHAASEYWGDDDAAVHRCRADIARADIVHRRDAVPGRADSVAIRPAPGGPPRRTATRSICMHVRRPAVVQADADGHASSMDSLAGRRAVAS
jgi:hypothetical protein